MELNQWSVDADNNNMPPPHGWPEGMNYSQVNDAARELMAVVKRWHDDLSGKLSAAGSANAYTVTLNAAYSHYFAGMKFRCKIPTTNTGASTINVNSIGSRQIVRSDDTAIVAGTLVAGRAYTFYYDGTNFKLDTSDISDAAIPANIARRNEANTFEGPVTLKVGDDAANLQVSSSGLAISAAEGISLNGVNVSDYARLSQPNVFTQSGAVTPAIKLESVAPALALNTTDGGPDGRIWVWRASGDQLQLRTSTDSGSLVDIPFRVFRSGTSASEIRLDAGTLTLNGVSTDDYARLSGLNEFSAQSVLVGTNFDNTRVRRGDNVGMLHLLGGQSAVAASGARVTLYGSDYAGSAAGDASIVAGSGGSISLSASAGDITLNNISYTDFARLSQPNEFSRDFLVRTSSDARLGLFSSSDGRGLLFRSGTNQYIYSSVDGTTVSGAAVLLAYNSVSDQMTLGSGASGARVQMRSAGGFLHNASAANSGGRITLSSSEASTAAQVGAPGDMRFVYQ